MPTILNASSGQHFNDLTTSYAQRRRAKHVQTSIISNPGFSWYVHPPLYLQRGMVPYNLAEQKEKFLKFGQTPEFKVKDSAFEIQQMMQAKMAQINFSLFYDAKRILDTVVAQFGSLDQYVASTYGDRISTDEATVELKNYLVNHKLEKQINVIWCDQLAASAQMTWVGPDAKFNKPESRKYTLLIKSSSENNFMRQRGVMCLADHEIGTHYIRSTNDGLQPWFADRKKYNLNASKSYETIKSEEGLAALHTVLNAKYKFLCMPAMLYYNACMAEYLSFRQLFHHLERYMKDPEQRWKHCMRVKRGLQNTDDKGGYGKDQRYFEGAVEIMRHLDIIDFNVLISGRICWDEVPRLKRISRLNSIKLPHFMLNMSDYMCNLRKIADTNGIRLASAPGEGQPTAFELSKTRDQLIDDLASYDVRVLNHRTFFAEDERSKKKSRCKSYSKWTKCIFDVPSSPSVVRRSSTREKIIDALLGSNQTPTLIFTDDNVKLFIECDLRHPIQKQEEYENVKC